jgi:hypothetical protein
MLCSNQRLLRVGIAGKGVHNLCIDACYDSRYRGMLAELRVLSLAPAPIPFSGKLVLLSNATCYDAGSVAGFLSTKLPDGRCCLLVLTGSQIDKKAGVPDHSNFEAARWTRQGLTLDRPRQDGCRRGWNRPRWRYVYVWRMCTVALLIN